MRRRPRRDAVMCADTYDLRLYTTGATPRSLRAIANLLSFCRKHLKGRHRLRIVDLYEEPSRAAEAQIVAAPTLVKLRPSPVRRIVGDMSEEPRLLAALNLPTARDL
ncbi:MAG: circadian clock KaiB family protein [Candidatus Polarisedimenticolia bacterium]